MSKTILQFSPIGRAIFSPAAGYNFRIRDNSGEFISIKPSTRPRGVKGEYGFETYNPNKPEVVAGIELPIGEWGMEPLKYGWLKLVAASDARPLMVTTKKEGEAVPEVIPEVQEVIPEVVAEVKEEEVVQEETPRERRNRLRRERRRAAKANEDIAEAA